MLLPSIEISLKYSQEALYVKPQYYLVRMDRKSLCKLTITVLIYSDKTGFNLAGVYFLNIIHFNYSPPTAVYIRQWIGSALVKIMACRLLGAKPLSQSMLSYYQLEP